MEILRILNVHNEEDIIEYNLDWYIKENIPTVVINNDSTDNTLNILRSYLGNGVVEIKNIKTKYFNRELLFSKIMALADKYSPKWIIFADADEFLESPKNESLTSFIERMDERDYNVIQFHNMEFWMTNKDNKKTKSPLERIKHYSYHDSNRFKIFKYYKNKTSLVENKGHAPKFSDNIEYKVSKEKGFIRHYKFRSIKQGRRKIKRVIPEPGIKDFGFHYLKFKGKKSDFIIDEKLLNKYKEDRKWILEKTFNGNRMSKQELISYLELKNEKDLNNWFLHRRGIKNE